MLVSTILWYVARRAAANLLAQKRDTDVANALNRIASSGLPWVVVLLALAVPALSALAPAIGGDRFSPVLEILCCAAIVSAWTDAIASRIFNDTLLAAGCLIAVAALIGHEFTPALTGALALGGLMLLFSLIPGAFSGGDVKLAAVIGAGLGFFRGSEAVMVTFTLLLIVYGFLLAIGRVKMRARVRVGPFLLAGVLTVAFAGNAIESGLASAFVHAS